jgi:hypothetical protein
MLIGSLLVLTACADSITAIDGAPVLKPAPTKLTAACLEPIDLPNRALTQAEVETLWRRDREALTDCGIGKAEVVAYYVDRDRRLTGS